MRPARTWFCRRCRSSSLRGMRPRSRMANEMPQTPADRARPTQGGITANDCLETLWQQAREAKGARARFFEHIRTISAYLVFPSWESPMNTLLSCNAPPTWNCRAVASSVARGLVFGADTIECFWPGRKNTMQFFPGLQSFTNRRRLWAHANGASCHGMVCLLHR